MSRSRSLVLYRRDGCHLCDDAEQLLVATARAQGVTLHLRRVDIDADPDLLARFMFEIPVVAEADGTVRLTAPIGQTRVRALLAAPDAVSPSVPMEVDSPMPTDSGDPTRSLPALSRRAAGIPGSPTVQLDARAKAMKAAGEDVLNLAVGEPDVPPPATAVAAAREAMGSQTKYAPPAGRPDLRAAVAEAARRDHGVATTPEMVIVGVGAKQVLYSLCHVLFDPGDKVLVPSPYWVSYPDQLTMSGCEPVVVRTVEAEGWRLTAAAVEAHIERGVRGIILNSPNNPTGAIVDEDELAKILQLCERHDMWAVSDEIYGVLTYDGRTTPSARTIASGAGVDPRRVIAVDGASKKFAMTGFRIGWAIAPTDVVDAASRLQSQITSSAAAPMQVAAVAALADDGGAIETMRRLYEERRDRFVSGLNRLGLTTVMPQGAFYAWASAAPFVGRSVAGMPCLTSAQVASRLLDAAKIACVPGEAFGVPGYLRMSFANPVETLDEALRRLEEVLASTAPLGASVSAS